MKNVIVFNKSNEEIMKWNDTYREYPLDKCLHELIEEQVKNAPGNPAVRFQDEQISFAELNSRANRYARYLRGMGIGPDSIVGVLMERSFEMAIALLGIIKSGGAYLPLDPAYPEDRLMFMLEDAGASVVFTQEKFSDRIGRFVGTKCSLDSEQDYLSEESGSDLESITTPGNLAYVIYTSGSTGKPKGCMLPHKAICNRLLWMQEKYRLTGQDRVLQKTPFTFDVSVWEFFWPMLSGACLVLAKPEGQKDPNYLVDLINNERITTCHFVPSMLRYFLSNPNVRECGTLRQVFTSGEALPFDLMMDFKKKLPAKLHNLYGPTEAAVDVTYWECEERADKKIPIGRPISNIQIYILDNGLNQVPIGHEGELHIGGIGLARGYLNRTELTAERFIDDPFSAEIGAKLYKTGDRAAYLPDGNIEYLGRVDFQVKLRGNRIELGEIESVLREHEAIEEAVVLVKDEASGDPKLVAYIVVKGNNLSSRQVREFVKSKLPGYMVPNIIVPMDFIPVTQHGKSDRQALPWPVQEKKWESIRSREERARAETIIDISAVLLRLFKEALDTNDLDIGDDLFDLGATSFTMVQIAETIEITFKVSIPVEVFLDEPTIKAITGYLEKELKDHEIGLDNGYQGNTAEPQQICKKVKSEKRIGNEEITNDLMKHFVEIMGVEEVKIDDDLFDLGATSFTMVQIVEKIEKIYNISIPVEVFLDDPSIKAIAEYIWKVVENKQDNKDVMPDIEDNSQMCLDSPARYRKIADSEPTIALQKAYFKESAYFKGIIRRDITNTRISFTVLGQFLSLLKQEIVEGTPKYLYPSAGGLNSIQTYLYAKEDAIEGIKKGIYYYHPEEHALYLINDAPEIDKEIFYEYDRPCFDNSGFALFFIAQLDAIKPVYQMVSPILVTLDAGYMGQLLLSRQADFNLGLCPVAGVDFERISAFFKLDETHRFIHCLLGGVPGRPSAERIGQNGIVGYIQKTGKSITDHLTNYLGDRTFSSFLDIDWKSLLKNTKYLNKQEHEEFHAKHANIRRFIGGEAVLPLERCIFNESDYQLRSAKREYKKDPIPFERFSKFMSLLRPINKEGRDCYLYPSISETYGVQTYLYIKENGIAGLHGGIYYYHPEKHALVLMTSELTQKVKPSYTPFNRKHYQNSAFCLFFIGQLNAIKPVYKDESLYLALLEAGCMGQLLMDKQAEFDIGVCPVGGLAFDRIRNDFKLDDGHELLHSFTCGGFEQEIPGDRECLEIDRMVTGTEAVPLNLQERPTLRHDIAIVGISGRYPGARSLDEYWEILKAGRSSIRELPEGRERIWGEEGAEPEDQLTATPRGGFLDDIDCFDNLLFNISPPESRAMDPQERLFLEAVWECLENAGYTAENLMRSSRKIGVFVGAMWNEYQYQGSNISGGGRTDWAMALHSSIANRISYYFNFNGPSIALNTSCSSAMTAAHFACESIKRGECDAAIVGGVNLITHSYHQNILHSLGLVSRDGECRPFGAQTTGWLPGEGVGAILIKPVEDAERDRDHIHGIIKGTAIGHSGRTVRFGAPNSTAQAESIKKVIKEAGIAAESISYVEAAAAGAGIADASEMNAVKNAVQERPEPASPCIVGSVKANIGHLESASAMSQIAKVLLQMKHKQIAPTINFKPINPLIQLRGSGLEIADELKPWSSRSPLRALINAFGATGTSGHIIIEEYTRKENKRGNTSGPALIPISAASGEQLQQQVARLHDLLARDGNASLDISDIGWTLQVGRPEMDERVAIVADNTQGLIEGLSMFLKGAAKIDGLFRGSVARGEENETTRVGSRPGDLLSLAERWVQGAAIEWNELNNGSEKRVPLPTYPFAQERHWAKRYSSQPALPVTAFLGDQDEISEGKLLLSRVEEYLRATFSAVLEIPKARIDAKANMGMYGVTSMMIAKLSDSFEKDYGALPQALLYEYQTIHDLADYFLFHHRDRSEMLFGHSDGNSVETQPMPDILMQIPKGHNLRERIVNTLREKIIHSIKGRY